MKKYSLEYILDQRRLVSHILFILIAVAGVTVASVKEGTCNSFSDSLRLFFLLFIQIEVFLFIASKLFKGLKSGMTRSEITGIMVSRFVLFIIACFIAALIIILIYRVIEGELSGRDTGVLNNFFEYEFSSWFKSTLGGLTFGAVIFIIIQWQDALQREQKLREENLIFQNETLRNQVNPHFLFNSLNTLSSLIATQPDVAEIFINKLSTIYRYILENSSKDRVLLLTELDFIGDYFELHKVRDQGKIVLNVDTSGASEYKIIPVSLQILIENAIKHNMATRENPLIISVYIENEHIVVKNNLQKMAARLKSTKVGLKNLAERVRLISDRKLLIDEDGTFFIVKIPLLK